jgi:hypothetical protein
MDQTLSGLYSAVGTRLGQSRIRRGVLMQARTCHMLNIPRQIDGSGLEAVSTNMQVCSWC